MTRAAASTVGPARRLARTARRGALPLAATLGLMVYLGVRFRIGIDDQVARCLPPYRVFLIDRRNLGLHRGDLVAFRTGARMAPFFPPERIAVKRVVGLPGDCVAVGPAATLANGRRTGEGLDLAGTLGQPPSRYVRELVVPDGALWIMGDTRDSFDSRYWGPLPTDQAMGRAYGIR